MNKLMRIIPYIVLAYSAMYATIWLHELGHSLAYHYFDCKEDLFNLHVPVYFANSNAYPVNETKEASLDDWQQFYISVAGIMTNLLVAIFTWLVIIIIPVKRFRWLYFFLLFFLLSNLLEAATYLTISNIYPLSDMIGVQQYSPLSRIPLFFLGLLLILAIISLIANAPRAWRRGMTIFSIATALSMGGLRLLFTLNL